jgi:2-aminobenzoate-CoA ligase
MSTPSTHIDTFAHDQLPPRDQWPDLIFSLPELHYPERFNIVTELLDNWVSQDHGHHPAILSATGTLTYKQLQAQVDQVAHVLTSEMDLVPGNRVLLRSANNAMLAVCWLAVAKAGLIVVATMPLLREKELGEIIDKAQVSAAICDKNLDSELQAAQKHYPILQQIIYFNDPSQDGLEAHMSNWQEPFPTVPTAAEDIALIAFTSGSTGQPKAAAHSHRDLLAACDCFPRSIVHLTANDICIGTPPLAFTYGLGALLLFPLRAGAATILLEKATPASMLEAINTYHATIIWSSPLFYRQMAPLAHHLTLPTLQQAISAGEALPTSTRNMWQEATNINIIDGIGSTEMFHIFIASAGSQIRPGATGKVVPGYQACILDPNGHILPTGEVGRLAIKGPTGCRYLADARQQTYVQNGWNLTGDAYLLDEDGYFWFQARTDDMIVAAGYNIAGPEVESALLEHPLVAECAVIGVPDPERGTIVKAFVVLKSTPNAANNTPLIQTTHTNDDETLIKTLQDFVKQRIAPYKYPRIIEFRTELPRAGTGKIQRYKLRYPQQE